MQRAQRDTGDRKKGRGRTQYGQLEGGCAMTQRP